MRDSDSLGAQSPVPRRAVRHKLFEPVMLRLDGAVVRAHLLDLSATGALAHCDRPLFTGDRVMIEAEALGIVGHVVWTRGKRFGIHFETPLADCVVDRVVRAL
ncbi:pilus assembly protein PilZ [Sphingobium sp. C100]|jgi:hypothetical protein|uniref:PilZ domain-containing protein n=1 Tax=Sphingobium sp. C100 TaxID=1207055 RepID=UPI0003D5A8AF|nr:PilZ domain-containing protein [Sphingobium sp. C100]ETI64475.1 pilus assembly protein PilZ [Sphingobium sp. C100]PHQ63130.1 MAG: PilZ domain-containing protein [Sphingobium sp.]